MNTGGRRAAKQVRNLELGLLLGGVVLLGLTMSMAGRFGYGLGHDELGRWGNAAFYVTVDAIGAALMSAIGILIAWRHYAMAALTTVAMVICVTFSVASIFGFQSANRTAVTKTFEATEKRGDERVSWLRGQVMDKNLAKDRQAFLAEEREQFKQLQQVQSDPDAQATELAAMLGVKKGEAQRGLNIGGAFIMLFLQFSVLSLRSYLRHRVSPAVDAWTTANIRELAADNLDNPNNPPQFSKEDARADLVRLIERGFSLDKHGAFSTLAKRWGWKVNTTSRWVRGQADFNAPAPPKRNRRPTEHANGNGKAYAS